MVAIERLLYVVLLALNTLPGISERPVILHIILLFQKVPECAG